MIEGPHLIRHVEADSVYAKILVFSQHSTGVCCYVAQHSKAKNKLYHLWTESVAYFPHINTLYSPLSYIRSKNAGCC